MRHLFILTLCTLSLSSFAQLDFPKWLMPDTLGQYVAIHGFISTQKDSMPTQGDVVVLKHGGEPCLHKFTSDTDGRFDIFLPANGQYSVRFEKAGYISKTIEVFTTNVPKKAWKNTFALDLAAYMETKPEGFNEAVSKVPFTIAKYDNDMKFFVFDEEFEKIRRAALDNEIQRCKDIAANKVQ